MLYSEKKTKFGKEKYKGDILKDNIYIKQDKIKEEKKTIANGWL